MSFETPPFEKKSLYQPARKRYMSQKRTDLYASKEDWKFSFQSSKKITILTLSTPTKELIWEGC